MRQWIDGSCFRACALAVCSLTAATSLFAQQYTGQPVRQASQPMTRSTAEAVGTPAVQSNYPGVGAPGECPHDVAIIKPRCGVQCPNGRCPDKDWDDMRMIPWEMFGHGEYIGPARIPAVPQYRLRVDDKLEFVFRITEEPSDLPYRLAVGDTLLVQSLTSEPISREVVVQPDGNISLLHLGQVKAANRTLGDLVTDLNKQYEKYVRKPEITVTPTKLNSRLQEFRATVDGRYGGPGGQTRQARVTPEGTVQLPAIGSVPAQGLTIFELKWEIEQRYKPILPGIEVTPVLSERAPRYIFVVGEVKTPGRYELVGPTSVMQGVALAGGWNNGGNLREVVVFRRDECWQLMATKLNVRPALYGKEPCPADDVWLRDSDILLVPKNRLLVADDAINLLFTRGIYSIVPVTSSFSFFTDLSGTGAVVVAP